jgi:hypothetical protein
MHVHVGARNENLDFFKNLVKLYARFEEALDSIMPPSRRGNEAYYARTLKRTTQAAIDAANSVNQLSRAVWQSSGASQPRYHKVNLEAFAKHGTVEFRQHSGTVEAGRATNWIYTCLQLVASAKEGKIGVGSAARIAWDLTRLVGKQRHCAMLIARPQGATNQEIRDCFGYRTLSARTNLKKAGLAFREERDRASGKTRFFALLPTANTPADAADVPATLDGLATLIEATPEQKEYFARRREMLAAARRSI